MKNNEIIQIAAIFALVAALLYRKYGKKNKSKDSAGNLMTGKSPVSSKKADDEYEPYSKKGSPEQN
jgi:hypothetical protein